MHVTALLDRKGREVFTVDEGARLSAAVSSMTDLGVGALVVTGSTQPMAGIISERDIVRALTERGPAALELPVAAVMSTDVTSCDPTTSCTTLMGVMTEQRIRHIPVLDEGRLVGLISIGDVVKARVDELERERRDLLDYVSAR